MVNDDIEGGKKKRIPSFTYAVLQNLVLHDRYQHQKAMQNVQLFFAWYRNAIHWKKIDQELIIRKIVLLIIVKLSELQRLISIIINKKTDLFGISPGSSMKCTARSK